MFYMIIKQINEMISWRTRVFRKAFRGEPGVAIAPHSTVTQVQSVLFLLIIIIHNQLKGHLCTKQRFKNRSVWGVWSALWKSRMFPLVTLREIPKQKCWYSSSVMCCRHLQVDLPLYLSWCLDAATQSQPFPSLRPTHLLVQRALFIYSFISTLWRIKATAIT